MNVLVTGGAGYIGSVCVEAWVEAGHRVTVIDDLSEGHREAVHPGARLVAGSLCRKEDLDAAFGTAQAEVVAHFAASALVGESMERPGAYFANNLGGGMALLEACVAHRVRKIVFSSTCAVYGVPGHLPITEESPLDPVSPYGETKRTMERMVHWYREIHGMDYTAFRYFNACGASRRYGEDHRNETHLIPNVLKVPLGERDHCLIHGTDHPTPDGTCVRDYIHVSDLARAHLLAAEKPITGCHNLGTGQGHSVREVIAACERVAGRSIPAVEGERRDGDPPILVAALSPGLGKLDWEPEHTAIEEMVESAWRWHRSHPHGYTGQ